MNRFWKRDRNDKGEGSDSRRSLPIRSSTNVTTQNPPTTVDYPQVNHQIWCFGRGEPTRFHIMRHGVIGYAGHRVWCPIDSDDLRYYMYKGGYLARPHPELPDLYTLVSPKEKELPGDRAINQMPHRQIHRLLMAGKDAQTALELFYDYELIPFDASSVRFKGPYKPPIYKHKGRIEGERSVPLHYTRDPQLPKITLGQVSNPESYRTGRSNYINVVHTRKWDRRPDADDYEAFADREKKAKKAAERRKRKQKRDA